MFRQLVVLAILWAYAAGGHVSAQAPGKVDFARDVLPVFRQNCIGCHGPWLAEARPRTNDDLSWRLLGLACASKNRAVIRKAMHELLAVQRSDGSWSDLASMDGAAYATGKALVALQAAGLPISDTAYQRGVQFLLHTQLDDGSWYVQTRAAGFQPYFDNGFPHGVDQWISAAGTSWATMALALASQRHAASSTSAVRAR